MSAFLSYLRSHASAIVGTIVVASNLGLVAKPIGVIAAAIATALGVTVSQ